MLRLTVSYGRREGRPEFSSESAECGLQLDLESSWLDDATYLQERIKAAYAMCVDAVDVQLHHPAAVQAAPPAVQAPPPPAVHAPARNGNGHGNGNGNGVYGAPTSAKTFLGWFGKQDQSVKDAVKAVAKARGLSGLYRDWADEDARAVYAEVTAPPPAYDNGNSHESFMRRHAQKKADEKAAAAAWAASAR
jgi:hypothetical protein